MIALGVSLSPLLNSFWCLNAKKGERMKKDEMVVIKLVSISVGVRLSL